MGNEWLAQVGTDPQARARAIAHAHSAFVTTGALAGVGTQVRPVVVQSWIRSSNAHVEQDTDPPVTLTDSDLADFRSTHPLAGVIDILRRLVRDAVEDGEHLMAVSDAAGRLLWVEGHRLARAGAARMNFVEGALWDEAHAGTNAPGTAIALDHEVQIFASEHFRHPVQAWTCSAAPIHDPVTGQILGVIDVTGGNVVANPLSLALVRAAASAAESELARQRTPRTGLWVPWSRDLPRLQALGRQEGVLQQASGSTRLSRRHTEVMIMLALQPDGLTGEQLAAELYDDLTHSTTLRVEMTRLRRVVGDLLGSRPYRLTDTVRADFLDVGAALRSGDLAGALAAYRGPLLPNSDAPGVQAQRLWLDTQLRSAILRSTDANMVRVWADRAGLDDLEIWEHLDAMSPSGSSQRAVAAARVHQLRADYGLGPDATFM
jgi:hypothetical protein